MLEQDHSRLWSELRAGRWLDGLQRACGVWGRLCLLLLFATIWLTQGCTAGECRYDADCPDGRICRQGQCTSNLVGDLCKTSQDCPVGQDCVAQSCIKPECQAGAQEPCYDGDPATKGQGLCQGGLRSCNNGRWSPCLGQILPNSEVCDQLDNDCNGQVDDNPSCQGPCQNGATRACFTGPPAARDKGVCRAGTETCQNGTWGPCLGQALPQPKETCGDSLDNDCNGQIDEGCGPCTTGQTRPCYSGPANTKNVGACKDGQQTCQNGQWTPCSGEVKPGQEVCDSTDNDCNGKVDDNPSCGACTTGQTRACYSGPAGTKGVGACREGTETCQNGTWGACAGEVKPSSETCGDKFDNNCNGQVDEGCGVCTDGAQEVCYSGSQGCSRNPNGTYSCNTPCRSGVRTCQGGQWTNCQNEKVPLPRETCGNNIDDDCNGQVDDGCGQCQSGQSRACYTGPANTKGIGTCQDGLQSCQGNNWGPCLGEVKPANEACGDGKDNNCNGTVDENCSTKLHKNCTADTDCDPGQICLASGGQGFCYQNCSSNTTVCANNADGRSTCLPVATSNTGQTISICVKQAAVNAACNPQQSVLCVNSAACLGGTCKAVTQVAEGGSCDSQASPPRVCSGATVCVSFPDGRDSVCLRQCNPQTTGSCGAGGTCLSLQSGGGVCLQSGCATDANCSYANHECVNDSQLGTNVCIPKPATGPVAFAGVCDPSQASKRCQAGLFCLRISGASTGHCSRACTGTGAGDCPSTSPGTVECALITSTDRACVVRCTTSCPTGLRCQAVGSANLCFP